jgi:hypothetical protein
VTAAAGFGAARLRGGFRATDLGALAFTRFFVAAVFAVVFLVFLAARFLAAVGFTAAFLAAAFFAALGFVEPLRPARFFDFCFVRLAMAAHVKDADGRDEPGHDASPFAF